MEKHTPGPWMLVQIGTDTERGAVYSPEWWVLADCNFSTGGTFNSRANAARIVQCVNAMEGIDEPHALRAVMDDPRTEKALKHHEELIIACRGALEAMTRWPYVNNGKEAVDILRAVLLKVTGEEHL